MSRCDVTLNASRPIIASSATQSPVSANAINDGPLIVPPGRNCLVRKGIRMRACIGRTSSIVIVEMSHLESTISVAECDGMRG